MESLIPGRSFLESRVKLHQLWHTQRLQHIASKSEVPWGHVPSRDPVGHTSSGQICNTPSRPFSMALADVDYLWQGQATALRSCRFTLSTFALTHDGYVLFDQTLQNSVVWGAFYDAQQHHNPLTCHMHAPLPLSHNVCSVCTNGALETRYL
jgi:hypothetical protein